MPIVLNGKECACKLILQKDLFITSDCNTCFGE